MKEQPRRFVLWTMALAILIVLSQQGRSCFLNREPVAFLPGDRGARVGMIVRLEGQCVTPGIYHFNCPDDLGTVINMTVPFFCKKYQKTGFNFDNVYTGSIVMVKQVKGKCAEITTENMLIDEKIILGIALDPNKLSVAQWEKLPGIGPALARRIIDDRQENGDYLSVEDLERVSGIGRAKVDRLKSFF